MQTGGRAEQVLTLTDYIEQTARTIAEFKLLQQHHIPGIEPLYSPAALYEAEFAMTVLTINGLISSLGGIRHYYDNANRRISCLLVGWHGIDPTDDTKQVWSVQSQQVNGALSLDSSVIDEIRASYLY